jgi:diaminohydroxyphosphoribosylaminopyrimidine deaminase/5-amino-6-(5-phosphoribosylamino)uracil reductase
MLPSAPHIDDELMRRAIALAMRGRGSVEPNPMVGCVIARQGRIIGEGYHQKFGDPHAEPNALAACTESPAGATAYVTLEPCCHTGKKTPPCVPRLISAGLGRVVIGCLDPNPQVSGRGAEELRKAGIEVSTSVLDAQARQLIAPFFKRMIQKTPYVTLKWAESANGKVAGPGGKTVWITNARSTHVVHELRARCDAILVGINTALADDPMLSARGVEIRRPLLRAVLDSELRLPMTSRLVRTAATSDVIVFCSTKAYIESDRVRVRERQDAGVRVVPLDFAREALPNEDASPKLSLIEMLHHLDGTHLLVEPGPTLARSFLRQGLADRVWVFRSPVPINQPDAIAAANLDYPETGSTQIDGDYLTEYLNPNGNAFFSTEQSPDLRLITGDYSFS